MSTKVATAPSLACHILENHSASVPVAVSHVRGARLLWPNLDKASATNILKLAVLTEEDATDVAWADRYGGTDIGGNGGSGRAGLFGGMYLKGIGQTPLIGRTTKKDHISGGAYLEEAVRETVFAELFAQELPWGAIRTAAILDTLKDQYWAIDPESDFPVARERRILLAREPMVRLAHFQRASHFTGAETLTGASDIRRVDHNCAALVACWGIDRVKSTLRAFWLRWSDQCAYLYVWRLTQGAPSTSNIALDGRLLDFGAASALPDWCAAVTFAGAPENGYELHQITQYLRAFYAEHHNSASTGAGFGPEEIETLIAECHSRYYCRVGKEMLRLAGFRRETVDVFAGLPGGSRELEHAARRVHTWYLRKFRISIDFDTGAEPWDFLRFWSEATPTPLRPLRAIADRLAMTVRGEPLRARMRARCSPRPALSRESFRRRLHAHFSNGAERKAVNAEKVVNTIQNEVIGARRDTNFEPEMDWLFGFAATGSSSYALFQRGDGTAYALKEDNRANLNNRNFEYISNPFPWKENGNIDGVEMHSINLL